MTHSPRAAISACAQATPRFSALPAAMVFLALAATSALAQTPGYHLPGHSANSQGSYGAALSADGRVQAGYMQGFGADSSAGFVWSEADGRYDFGVIESPIAHLSRSAAISGDGSTVAGQRGNVEAFRWNGPGTFQNLGFLQSFHDRSDARGVSGDGSIVVGSSYRTQSVLGQAYRWTQAGGMQGLGYTLPTHVYSEANAISRDGNVIVGMSQDVSGQSDAFRWTTAGGMQVLPPLPISTATYAYGTNHDGSIIVGAGGGVGVLWNSQGAQALTSPPGWSSRATDTNDDGSVVLGLLFNSSSTPAIWTPATGWQTPDVYFAAQGFPVPAGWRISSLTSLSADGRTFSGTFFLNDALVSQAFVLSVPAPGTVLFALSVCVCSAPRRRRA